MMQYLKRGIAVLLVAPMAPSAQPAMAATQLMEIPSRKFSSTSRIGFPNDHSLYMG